MRQLQSPLASSAPPTPTTPVVPYASNKGIPVGLEGTIAPADMLNVLSAHRESVNTADGKDQDLHLKILRLWLKRRFLFDWSIWAESLVLDVELFYFTIRLSLSISSRAASINVSYCTNSFRQETSMSALWSTIWLRDQLKSSHSSASSRHPSSLSILLEDVYAQQHSASTYSARAQAPANRCAVSKLSCSFKWNTK